MEIDSMDHTDIIRMANQIAVNLKSNGHDEAVKGLAEHINAFWEPRMRRELFELLDQDAKGLDPLVLEAASLIRRPAAKAA
jgi:formate dehydrogenase subunit delta